MRPPFFFFVLLPLVRLVGVKWLRWWPLALSSLQQQLLQSPRGQWEREMGKITDDLKLLRKKDYTRVEPAGPCCKREKLAKKSPSFFPESYTLNGKWAKIIASMSSSSHVVWARPESCIKRETHWSDRSTNVLRRKIEEISWSTCLSSTRIENGNLCRQNSTISLFFVPWLENSHKQSCHHSFFRLLYRSSAKLCSKLYYCCLSNIFCSASKSRILSMHACVLRKWGSDGSWHLNTGQGRNELFFGGTGLQLYRLTDTARVCLPNSCPLPSACGSSELRKEEMATHEKRRNFLSYSTKEAHLESPTLLASKQ